MSPPYRARHVIVVEYDVDLAEVPTRVGKWMSECVNERDWPIISAALRSIVVNPRVLSAAVVTMQVAFQLLPPEDVSAAEIDP